MRRRLSSGYFFVAGALTISLGLAVGASSTLIAPARAHAEDAGSGLSTYNLHAAAGGIQFFASGPTGQGPGSADGGIPFSSADLRYGPSGHALSSLLWPGSIGGNLGSLILVSGLPTSLITGQLPIPLPPPPDVPPQLNPLLPYLNDPIRAEAATGGEPDVSNNSVPGTSMSARVEDTLVKAQAQLAATANLLTGNQRTTSTLAQVQLTGADQATAIAETAVMDVTLPGGVVKLGAVTSYATAKTDGVHASVEGSTKVLNASIAGIPVTIDEKGITIQSSVAPLNVLTDAVNGALKQAGIGIYIGKAVKTVKGPAVQYDAGSVVITLPEDIVLEIGGAQVTVSAAPAGVYGGGGDEGGTDYPVTGGDDGGVSPDVPSDSGDGGTGPTLPDTSGSGSNNPGPVISQPAAAALALPGGLGWGWIALVVLGAGFIAIGLRRLPDRVLVAGGAPCSLASGGDEPVSLDDVPLGDEL